MAKILNIRGVEETVARQFAAGAAIRGVTQAEFLKLLLDLRVEAAIATEIGRTTEGWEVRAINQLTEWMTKNEMGDMYA